MWWHCFHVGSSRFTGVNYLMGSGRSYSALCKQTDVGFNESEIIRTVLKITKPGTFRKMLMHKDD